VVLPDFRGLQMIGKIVEFTDKREEIGGDSASWSPASLPLLAQSIIRPVFPYDRRDHNCAPLRNEILSPVSVDCIERVLRFRHN